MLARLGTGIALASMTALLLVGCTPDAPVETTPPPTTEPTPDSPRTEQAVEADALEVAQEFVALVDEGFANSALPMDRLQSVATQAAIDKVQAELNQFIQMGWHIEGASVVDTPSLTNWNEADQDLGTAQLLACLDTSNVNTTIATGESAPGSEPRQPRLFTVEYDGEEMLIADVSVVPETTELSGCGS